MKNGTACFYLSGMYISGVKKQGNDTAITKPAANQDYLLAKDMKKAFEFAYKACELRNMYACANLSQMYARGDGTEKSQEQADKYKKLALDMQEEVKKQQKTLNFQQGVLPN